MHGAVREKGLKGNPERLYDEQWQTCNYNEDGIIARDAVSCRRPHADSAVGGFTPGFFDEKGKLIGREGYMVPCRKDGDCRRACGIHPTSQRPYVCMPQYTLYDFMTRRSEEELEADKAEGLVAGVGDGGGTCSQCSRICKRSHSGCHWLNPSGSCQKERVVGLPPEQPTQPASSARLLPTESNLQVGAFPKW